MRSACSLQNCVTKEAVAPLRNAEPRLREGQFLGSGSFKVATVRRRGKKLVAVLSSSRASLLTEMMAMMKITKHRHVLPLLYAEYDPRLGLSLVVPIAPFGCMVDLADHLDFEGEVLDLAHTTVALAQIACAAAHLNSQNVVHGDIAARNVLVHAYERMRPLAMHVSLADFGSATEGKADLRCLRPLARELHSLAR